ncbi:hypothetical protein [Sphingomonas sp.]|uniref:hypothetical protein n=1 Tax=Sphingomonas sp. TaxID=28214 RepID=UPI003CC58675
MKMLQRIQPAGAWADLRYFFGQRRPHQWGFAALAVTLTAVTIWAFWHDSQFRKVYHRDIIYVQQWRRDRTDAEVIAQQRIDGPIEARQRAEREQADAARRAQFQQVKDRMDALHL